MTSSPATDPRAPAPAAERAPWRATGLDHVSVTSGDLDRSLAFYRDLLGLKLRARGDDLGPDELRDHGGAPDAIAPAGRTSSWRTGRSSS